MIPQLDRLPAIECHKLELLFYSQTVYLAFWDRADGSAILGFTRFCRREGTSFSNASYGVSDALCCNAVCGCAKGEEGSWSIGPQAILG